MAEKILIVDDDLETLRLVGLMLQRQGYNIVAANNGTQAIAMARNELPDLIVLDVMMPDMDGFQVTHELRNDPVIASTPILMFTAKSQVDDKVAGYDAGADDYLTKPVHPAELVAHIKALLVRMKNRPPVQPTIQRGYILGVVGCKGGLGVSTLTLNLAASYARQYKTDVISVELRPGQGSWGIELGFSATDGLDSLLKMKPSEITPAAVESHLVKTSFGVRLLLASEISQKVDFSTMGEKLAAIVNAVSLLSPMVMLDLGTPFLPGFEKLCSLCQEIIAVTEPHPVTVKRTKILLDEIRSYGAGAGKVIDLILFNRIRSDIQLNSIQVSDMLNGEPVTLMIPSAPEQAYQASLKNAPVINVQPEGLIAQQINHLAEIIKSRT